MDTTVLSILMLLVFATKLVRNKEVIQVGWLVPFTSHPAASFPHNVSSSVAALALGIETVQENNLLPDYDLNVTFLDSGCSSKHSLGVLVDQLFILPLDVVIGPACAQVVQAVGELLAYRNIPLLNWLSIGQAIDAKTDLNTYIRTMAPVSSLGSIMTLFYYYTGWRRMVIISAEGADHAAAAATIETNLAYRKLDGFHIVHHYSDVSTNASNAEIDSILNSTKHESRIIIISVPRDEIRAFMLRAQALGMADGDYQYIYTDPRLLGAEDERLMESDVLWKRNDAFDQQARQAFENVLYFVLGHTTTNTSSWADGAIQGSMQRVFGHRTGIPQATWPDQHSPYLHDTIVLYARTVNQSMSQNGTRSGADIFRWAPTVYFKGLSGDVTINPFGDRQPTFFVYDLNSDGRFHKVASLQYTITELDNRVVVNSSFTVIIWGDGRTTEDYIPPDTPDCGFYDELCPEPDPPVPSSGSSSEVLIASVSATMLIVLLVMYLIFRWWRWEKDINNMTWRIRPSDLDHAVPRRANSMNASGRFALSNLSVSSASHAGTANSGTGSVITRRHSVPGGQIFAAIALYKGETVALKRSKRKRLSLDRAFLLEAKNITEMKHVNITHLVGICTVPDNIMAAWEYCSKGSIQDVIENDDIPLDTMFKLSLAIDVCQGLEYMHKSALKHHGNLKSSNCVIDNRWVCKLTDFGLQKLRPPAAFTEEVLGEHAFYARLFWTAPELLRKILRNESTSGSQQADIYALAVVLKEVVCRDEPYSAESEYSPKEIIHAISKSAGEEEGFRPAICDIHLDSEYRHTNMEHLIRRCWEETPEHRPNIKAVVRTLNKINPYKKSSVVDNMIVMMEKYTNNLEDIVAERTEQLEDEKRKTDALLYRMLPKKVADDLKFGRSVQAEAFDAVTIYFSDIVRFTDLAGESTPLEIVALLNALYTIFDDIIEHYDVYKVETIGDAYMIVSGLPERNGNLHVREMAGVALHILQRVITFQIPHMADRQLQIRIGLHTGAVVAGVVGLTMPRYCLFGDTVNTASRMESNGKPQMIHMSCDTMNALLAFPEFNIEERGELEIKGKGTMTTYWLTGKTEERLASVRQYNSSTFETATRGSMLSHKGEDDNMHTGCTAVADDSGTCTDNLAYRVTSGKEHESHALKQDEDDVDHMKTQRGRPSDDYMDVEVVQHEDTTSYNEYSNSKLKPNSRKYIDINTSLEHVTSKEQSAESLNSYDLTHYSQQESDHTDHADSAELNDTRDHAIGSRFDCNMKTATEQDEYSDCKNSSVDDVNATGVLSISSSTSEGKNNTDKLKTTVFYMVNPAHRGEIDGLVT